MHRIALLALTGIIALSACSSGGSVAGRPPADGNSQSTSSFKATPYQIPNVTSPAVQDAERRAKAKARAPKNSYGGVPTLLGILDFLDAPNFGPGSQINLAIAGVQAMSAGTAYPVVSYDAPVVINVLDYQHSSLSLGSNAIPAISYDGFSIAVDPSQSTVVINGVTYPVQFGSFDKRTHAFTASAPGIQSFFFSSPFNGANSDGHFMVDFAAIDSVAIVNGVAEIGPMLRGADVANSAVITGMVVSNAGAAVGNAVVRAIAADGSVAAMTATSGDGSFELHAMAAGNYQVVVSNTFVTDSGQTVTSQNADRADTLNAIPVSVPAGYRVDLGHIQD